ncbi:MAG: ribbon-helix-helix domain-containing protein, partial [Tepidiformaceae bacterium]
WYAGGMKVKTSVTLSDAVLCQIDREIGEHGNRSEFIEKALKRHFRLQRKAERDEHDWAILRAITEGRVGEPPDAWEFGSDHYWATDE